MVRPCPPHKYRQWYNKEEINVKESEEVEEAIVVTVPDSPDTILTKAVAELLKQAKALLTDFPPSNKEEALLIFKPLLSKFPQIVGTPFQDEVSTFIQDALTGNANLQFELMEIKSWWREDADTN